MLLATLVIMGVIFAMGVVVGRAAKKESEDTIDPLAQLDHAAGLVAKDKEDSVSTTTVEREKLTFPTALADVDEPNEATRSIAAAAAAEESELSKLHDLSSSAAQTSTTVPTSKEHITATLPASVGAGQVTKNLEQMTQHDPLLVAAINEPENTKEQAQPGHDGEFTLQVISYESPEPAHAFAEGLRARGHSAFVVKADVPGRGRYYRVRIGPFESRWKAERYRRNFEEEERMNTFVIRRPKEE